MSRPPWALAPSPLFFYRRRFSYFPQSIQPLFGIKSLFNSWGVQERFKRGGNFIFFKFFSYWFLRAFIFLRPGFRRFGFGTLPLDSRPPPRVYNPLITQSGIQIGDLAKRAGVTVDTVRFYERRQLLPRAPRSGGGFRLFAPEVVERISFIRQAQELGFSLEEIKGLLATGGAAECRKVRDLLQRKLSELDERLKAMKGFRRVLGRQLSACNEELKRNGESACCPVAVGAKGKKPRD